MSIVIYEFKKENNNMHHFNNYSMALKKKKKTALENKHCIDMVYLVTLFLAQLVHH